MYLPRSKRGNGRMDPLILDFGTKRSSQFDATAAITPGKHPQVTQSQSGRLGEEKNLLQLPTFVRLFRTHSS